MGNKIFKISLMVNIVLAVACAYLWWTNSWHAKVPGVLRTNVEVYSRQRALYSIYQPKVHDIIMLGDSITFGIDWTELLSRQDVVNRGISGDTTEGVLKRLPEVYALTPKLCFIMIGINDFFDGADVTTVYSNYVKIVLALIERGITPVIQSTLFIATSEPDLINKKVALLNTRLAEFARNKGIEFIDLNSALCKEGFLEKDNTYDGIHLSARGYQRWRGAMQILLDRIGGWR